MRDFGEYLRDYRAYVSANLVWRKALMGALVWLAGMVAPFGAKALVQLPNWVPILRFQAQVSRTANSRSALARGGLFQFKRNVAYWPDR